MIGIFQQDMSKSVFIAIPKKAGTTNCENHRAISFMSHVIKIFLKIIKQMEEKIRSEVSDVQCSFVEGI